MSGQLALLDVPAVPVLTPAQLVVLSLVETRDEGVPAEEAGAAAHGLRSPRPHAIAERCWWCETDGEAILRALARKGLAHPERVHGEFRYFPGPERVDPAYNVLPDGF